MFFKGSVSLNESYLLYPLLFIALSIIYSFKSGSSKPLKTKTAPKCFQLSTKICKAHISPPQQKNPCMTETLL